MIRRSRLKKSTLFEMEPSPELEAVQTEYCASPRPCGPAPSRMVGTPMKDRDIFDFLGFD